METNSVPVLVAEADSGIEKRVSRGDRQGEHNLIDNVERT